MGLLVNGKWADEWYDTAATGGRFMRTRAQFRYWITAEALDPPVKTVSGPRRGVTTFMYRWPVRGRIER